VDVIYALLSPLLTILLLWFWKPWASAYAGEKAKNLARKEDLEKILAEVRAVTITQKEIESKISSDMWGCQWRLNQTRDAYAGLLRALSGVLAAFVERNVLIKQGGDPGPGTPMYGAIKVLDEAHSIAYIFCSKAANDAVDELYEPSSMDIYGAALHRIRGTVIREAQRDLGLGPLRSNDLLRGEANG
jgi:hypothetical protein